MIQEYLFIDGTNRAEVESYKPDKVTTEFYNIDNSDCWIASYSVSGENEYGAKILSDINEYVTNNFSSTVLSNGSSAYYNRMLFPFINEFERKLRKLLYLKSALNKGDKVVENISGLESKDLGEIFTLMFTDDNFIKSVKKIINDKTWAFTKEEIIQNLNDIEENTKWDSLIGADAVSELRQNFVVAKNYRNDTMHAHNINTKTYKETRKLFKKINEQLDEEIGKIIEVAETEPERMNESLFNSQLSLAMKELDWAKQLREVISSLKSPEVLAIRQQISDDLAEVNEMRQELVNLINSVNSSEVTAMRQELANLIKSVNSSEVTAMRQQIAEIHKLTKR